MKTADLLVQQALERPKGWIHRSFALHELDRTEAYSKLNSVRQVFSDQWIIPYNLACYLTQLDRIKEAARELHAAMQLMPARSRLPPPLIQILNLRKCLDKWQ